MGGSEALKAEIVGGSRYPTPQVGNITLPTAHCNPLSSTNQGEGKFLQIQELGPWPTNLPYHFPSQLDRGEKIR